MPRKVFFSFHYATDVWRAGQVRNMGHVESDKPCSDNDWETITRGGDTAIENWINGQIKGTSCTIVLIGKDTSSRKWVNYEIKKSWNENKGLLGIYIHRLKNQAGQESTKGPNPFDGFTLKEGTVKLSSVAPTFNPSGSLSNDVYASIRSNLDDWVETAIRARETYK